MNSGLFKLKLISPFHLNPARDSQEKTETVISSDMLVSALAICHIKLYGHFNRDFFSDKLRLSSLFPFYKDTLFFPVPLYDFWTGHLDRALYKKLKKIRYLEESLWRKVAAGERLNPGEVRVSGSFGIGSDKAGEVSGFFREEDLQRLGKDPFYYSQVRLKEEGGLFFLYEVDPGLEPNFKASLRLLADEGLGGDRTVGKGLFKILPGEKENPFQFPIVGEPAQHMMSLSFFIPTQADAEAIDFRESYYHLQHKRGWYNTYGVMSLKKKGIFGFSEGSVFKTTRKPTGKNVTLLSAAEMQAVSKNAPAFDVLRSGIWYGISLKIPIEDSREVNNAGHS